MINITCDTVVLTESWLDGQNDPLYCIPAYSLYSKPRVYKDGGGICIYVYTSLPSSVLKLDKISICSFQHHEIIISPIGIPKRCIVSIYRPLMRVIRVVKCSVVGLA